MRFLGYSLITACLWPGAAAADFGGTSFCTVLGGRYLALHDRLRRVTDEEGG